MQTNERTIRSTGWKTDFLIGFPEGLYVLLFTTHAAQGLPLSVQTFYTLNTGIWIIGATLVGITAYSANKGDSQHDESTLSPEERKKLQKLDISDPMIGQIAAEMEKDAALWEKTLESIQVRTVEFNARKALRSALVTAASFLLGGIIPLFCYLANENFPQASRTAITSSLVAATAFGWFKAAATSQRNWTTALRYLIIAGVVLGAALLLGYVLKDINY
ncbi:VIT1/CCC1 transporter family protein [Chitinophaga pendula]|uniref:VIT1/CCC1 transporter family protein n=1 Tax=Chitinophaga TaxID=79328 RepID=UPI000BAE7328|nr:MULTISPECIES: VIT1/CCC1 transporter family protein [Chitinophaga]ASZ12906.1 hypothetical protein CK934_19060 [Chitinophaga sp. MD30]UCJ09465.1 VIT1/CCC1 transporter family protein [Chitinophaga pendula]